MITIIRSVRMKGCGKSAPQHRQRRWHGKPHREQDHVGTAGTMHCFCVAGVRAGFRVSRPGRSREAVGNNRPRGMAINGEATRRNRTRLTDYLILYTLQIGTRPRCQTDATCGDNARPLSPAGAVNEPLIARQQTPPPWRHIWLWSRRPSGFAGWAGFDMLAAWRLLPVMITAHGN